MRSTFKVLFYVKKGSEKPNGNLPLMCRITVDGEIKQFSCKMDVPPRLWDVKNSRASGKSVEAQRINLAVDKIRVEVNRRYQELMQADGYVTAAKLKDAYLAIGVKQETLLKLFEQHNAEFEKKVGHSRAQGTFTRYRTVCNHIREFLPHTYKREDIPLKELNLTFTNDFEYFLCTEKKCRTNTVWGYMIVLKHIVSIARNDEHLPFNLLRDISTLPKAWIGLPHPNGDTDAHGRIDEERHPRACMGLVRLFGVHGFGVFGREEPHRRPPANILRWQPLDNHPKKEDQHRIEHPSFGRSQVYHREVQGAGKGRSCFPCSE